MAIRRGRSARRCRAVRSASTRMGTNRLLIRVRDRRIAVGRPFHLAARPHQVAASDSRTGLCSSRARENAAALHGSHATAFESTSKTGIEEPRDYNEGMLAPAVCRLLALAFWIGGLVVLGAIAAPSVFDVLAARHVPLTVAMLAGAIFGEMLRRFHLLSYGCGAILLGSLLARGRAWSATRPVRAPPRARGADAGGDPLLRPCRFGKNRGRPDRDRRCAIEPAGRGSATHRLRTPSCDVNRVADDSHSRRPPPHVPRIERLPR